jgi:hypothetical protein
VRTSGIDEAFRGHRVTHESGREDGIFVQWRWDGRTLVVQGDPYGFHPLFYFCTADSIGIATSVLRLLSLGAPAEPDYDALALFIRLGFYVGDDTPFRAIRTLPPGGRLEWQEGVLAASGEPWSGKSQVLSRDDAIDAYIVAFRRALERRLPRDDRAVVPLSGGRDSRHILLELCELRRRPKCAVTIPRYPPRAPEDERVASILAARADVPHVLLDQPPDRLGAELRKNWLTHLCADEHAWYMRLVDYLETEATIVYDGTGGALSVAGRFLSPNTVRLFGEGKFSELADRLIRKFGVATEEFLSSIIAKDMQVRLGRDGAICRLAGDLARHAHAADPAKSFNFWNRTRREIALVPYALMNRIPAVFSPYLDVEVYELLSSLAPTLLAPDLRTPNKSFHSDTIKRAYPKCADVPFEDSTAPMLDARPHYRRFTFGVARHIVLAHRHRYRTLNNRYLWPRLLAELVNPRYGECRPWLAFLPLYFLQIETAQEVASKLLDADSVT